MNQTPQQTASCIPAGWTIVEARSGELIVQAPCGNPGGMTLTGKERPLAQRLLYSLARDMLDSRNAQHQAAGLTVAHVPHNWSTTMPTEGGLYWNKCAEGDFVPTKVYVFEREGVLMCVSEEGITGLEGYHNGPTETQWALVSIPVHTEAIGPHMLLQAFKASAQDTHQLTTDKDGQFKSSTTKMAFEAFIDGATWAVGLR